MHPSPGTWPTTQACALTRNRIGNPSVHRSALSPLSHTNQGLFCFEVKSFGACWRLMNSNSPHAGILACSQLLAVHFKLSPGDCVWSLHGYGPWGCWDHVFECSWVREYVSALARTSSGGWERLTPGPLPCGPWREQVNHLCETRSQARASREPESQPLCYPGIVLSWVWDGPGAFSRWQMNFPNFHMLQVSPPPNQSLISPGWNDRPFWSSNFLSHFVFYGSCARLPLVPPPIWCGKWGRACPHPIILLAFCIWDLSTDISSFLLVQCKSLTLLLSCPMGDTPWCSEQTMCQ